MSNLRTVIFDMGDTTFAEDNAIMYGFIQAAHDSGLNAPPKRFLAMMGQSEAPCIPDALG